MPKRIKHVNLKQEFDRLTKQEPLVLDKHEPEPTFKQNWRGDNPSLHLFYVKGAVKFLTMSELAQRAFGNCSNLNADDYIVGLQSVDKKHISENAAFYDAREILNEIKAAQEEFRRIIDREEE